MCLTKINPVPKKLLKYFWKVFYLKDDKLFSEICGNQKPLPINKEIHEKQVRPNYHIIRYPYGFHAFFNKKDAIGWTKSGDPDNLVVRKVKLSGIHTAGEQHLVTSKLVRVVVATKMTILKE